MEAILCLDQLGLEVSPKDREGILEKAHDLTNISKHLLTQSSIKKYPLPFYEEVDLIQLTHSSWHPANAQICFLKKGNALWHLDGSSMPIHAINDQADIYLTDTTVLEYLAFFCFFIHGDEGPFFIIDRLNNTFLPKSATFEIIEEKYRPPQKWGQDINGDWRISALVYYGNNVFFADFIVELSGMVTMEQDHPILANLEDKIQVPLTVLGELN